MLYAQVKTFALNVVSIILLAAALLVAGLATASSVTMGALETASEAEFVTLINQSRSTAGLEPLVINQSLVSFARAHSVDMQEYGDIFHSSNLASATTGWEALAENVGVGYSAAGLHANFLGSPGHRANILGNYNQVGAGVTHDGERIWVTVVFMRATSFTATTTTVTATTQPTVIVTPPATRQATVDTATLKAIFAGYLAGQRAIKELQCP